jgi:hypothetical protein
MASCQVLTHPAFNRPTVVNVRRPGPKKGCVSFARARRLRHHKAASPAADNELSKVLSMMSPERRAGFEQGYFGLKTLAASDATSREPHADPAALRASWWPFETVTRAEWLSLSDAERRNLQGYVRFLVDQRRQR